MRKALIAAGGLALALTLGGCGDNGIGGTASPVFDNAQSLVAEAKEKTTDAETSKFTFEMDVAGQKMTGNGAGRYEAGNSAMSMTMDMGGQQTEMRFVGNTMYFKMPGGMPGMDPNKPWVKITAGGDDPLSKMLGEMDQLIEQNDPSKILEQIGKAGTITESGETQLDGQDATHYKINLELAKMADQLPAGMTQDSLKQLEKSGVKSMPIELWLNSENLPMQFVMDMTELTKAVSEQSGGAAPAGRSVMTMKYSDWGAPVDVAVPPADQVSDFQMPAKPN
ncbi:MAG: hypothetical protein ACRDSE_09265 [Pseudonocardiaceae bacterium]